MKRLTDDELDSLEYHGCSSGTSTPQILRTAILQAVAEIRSSRDGDEYQRGIADCIKRVKDRRGYFELYRGHGAMQTKPVVFAIVDEMVVLLEAMLERAKAGG